LPRLVDRPIWWEIARMSAADYLRQNRLRMLAWTVPTRAIAQSAFLVLLGGYAGGPVGRANAFIGAVVLAPTVALVTRAPDLIGDEIWQGTIYRLRLGRLPILAVVLVRSWVYLAEGLAAAVIAACVVGPQAVGWSMTATVLERFPVLALASGSCLCFGLFLGAAALRRRIDLLVVNAASYLLLLTSGAVVPPGANRVLDTIGPLLPLRAGISAMRPGPGGGISAGALCLESMVGLGWLVAAWVALIIDGQLARSRGRSDPGPI
jgi:ABC-2 type transport system permease protein